MMRFTIGVGADPKELKDRYRNLINSLLLASTFAGTVSLSIILTPGNNNTTIPGIVELALDFHEHDLQFFGFFGKTNHA